MPLPAFIQSQVDPAAITKVTRLFNNTLGDILDELIQNARRAGATRVDLTSAEAEGVTWLTISDDGEGIADPAVILALGRSDWEADVREREDPAGMGIFSLGGRHVEVRSRAGSEDQPGWCIFIEPDDWESGAPIAVLPVDHPRGTQIRFALDAQSIFRLEHIAQDAALYCPIPVTLNGAVLPHEDFLTGAEKNRRARRCPHRHLPGPPQSVCQFANQFSRFDRLLLAPSRHRKRPPLASQGRYR